MHRLSVLLLLVAMGCDAVPPLNAADASDQQDGSIQPGDVTVTLLMADDTPIPDVPVLFNNPDGTVKATATTGADGKVTQLIEPGSSVTLGLAEQSDARFEYQLVTAVGIMPGMDIVIRGEPTQQYQGDIRFQLPSTTVITAPVTEYEAMVGCENRTLAVADTAQPFNVGIYRTCSQNADGDYEALAVARSVSSKIEAFTFLGGLPAPGMTGNEPVNNFPAWSTTTELRTLGLLNAWAGIAGASVSLKAYRGGASYDLYSERGFPAPAAGSDTSLDFHVPRGVFNDGFEWQALFTYGDPDEPEGAVLYGQRLENGIVPPTDYDIGAQRPPLTTNFVITDTAFGDETITWVIDGDPLTMDGYVLNVRWSHEATGVQRAWAWATLLPPGTLSYHLPEIPAGFLVEPVSGAEAWPPPDAAERGDKQLIGVELSTIPGYRAFVETFGASLLGGNDPSFPKGSTFRAVVAGFN